MEEGRGNCSPDVIYEKNKRKSKTTIEKKKGELSSLKGRRTNSVLSTTLSTALRTSSDPCLSLT